MLKPIKFQPPLPERRDPNFERFEEQVKHRSKRELLYMCFLAVEALAVRDAADKASEQVKEFDAFTETNPPVKTDLEALKQEIKSGT